MKTTKNKLAIEFESRYVSWLILIGSKGLTSKETNEFMKI